MEIKDLIKLLPNNDSLVAARLLAEKNYSELSLLVYSYMTVVEKNQRKKHCPEEYIKVPLDKLFLLKEKVDAHVIDILYGKY